MSWFNSRDKDIPEKLKGKTEEQILADLNAADQLKIDKAAADAAKLDADAKVTEKDTELATTKARLAELELNAQRQQRQQGGGGNNEPQQQGPTSILIDEEAAWNQRLGPIIIAQMNTQAMLAISQAKEMARNDPKRAYILKKYEKEINDKFNTIGLQQRIYPNSYLNAVNVVLGEHIDEVVDAMAKKEGDFAVEPAGGGSGPKPAITADTLTDEEAKTAKRMGIKPEDWLKRRKSMQFVGA